jgi:excisionase family DNA binding protein
MDPLQLRRVLTTLSIVEAARQVGCHKQTLWRWVRVGVRVRAQTIFLNATRAGGRWKVRQEDVDDFLAKCRGACPRPEEPGRTARRRSGPTSRPRRSWTGSGSD